MNPKSASKRGKMLEECLIVRCPCIHEIFWQQHHAPRNLVVRVNTASFWLCACALSHEDWGNRHQEPGKFTEFLFEVVVCFTFKVWELGRHGSFHWKKIVGVLPYKSVAAVNAIKALAFINAGVMLWKRNAISQGGNRKGSSGAVVSNVT